MHRIGLMVLGWVASVALTLVDAAEYNADDYPMYYADHLEEDYNETAHKRNMDFVRNYIFPKFWDWVLIASHSIIFVVGLIGNAMVCIAVYRNHTMRTVTNYFIVNLAVADFLVILLCLPSTVLWDITETWFLGLAMCKTVPYLQVRLSRHSLLINFSRED